MEAEVLTPSSVHIRSTEAERCGATWRRAGMVEGKRTVLQHLLSLVQRVTSEAGRSD